MDDDRKQDEEAEVKPRKESHKSKHDKTRKKRKGRKRHGKHSKNHRKTSHKTNHESKRRSRKHGKNKDKEGKKSKNKRKKSKHHDVEPEEPVLKRSVSQESLESSNRSRSASPLPSIHTPSPSPTPPPSPSGADPDKRKEKDLPDDPDFFKDKYDKIKERRRHAASDTWESLLDLKQKAEKQKQNIQVPEKEKNQKLRETIEKLKAKNEKYKGTLLFNSLFTPTGSENGSHSKDYKDEAMEFSGDDTNASAKDKPKKGKKSSAKNASASEALEQAAKDISKWLDDAPKNSAVSSPCDSPAQTISTDDHDSSRLEDESSLGEKPPPTRKELSRKRPSSREPKTVKRREIQRTIERLQPGKSKGNLLTNISSKSTEKTEDVASVGTSSKPRDSNKAEGCSPKLSLGSVLATVEFTLGNDHNFNNDLTNNELPKETVKENDPKEVVSTSETKDESIPEVKTSPPTKKDAEVETDPPIAMKPSQEKATPNLSAWFKAFGAPKSTIPTTSTKKKPEETEAEEKTSDKHDSEGKTTSPKNTTSKYDSPNDLNSPIPDGGDSPIPSVSATPRQRRTSTGSSVSERSSFSQDLDSPRHQMSHTSPLLRSPASPRTDDFQKITYPIINGTVRAGFYHDTTSVKSSPEKSCSPRDGPQSPYSPYSPHVYASNSNAGSATPNYFVDHNKSPLPTYGQNAPPYYDTSKAPLVSKPPKVHEDYTSLSPDSFQQNHFNGPFSPTPSPYPPAQTNYSQPQISPQPSTSTSQPVNSVQILPDPKNSLFPVKKRAYNEPESVIAAKKVPDDRDTIRSSPITNDYSKSSQSLHSAQNMPSSSVDDIALALSGKSEAMKLNMSRDKNNTLDYIERHASDKREKGSFDNNVLTRGDKEIDHIDLTKSPSVIQDDIDMVNMGYLNAEERRNNSEPHDVEFVSRDKMHVAPMLQKGFEIEAIAINLGMNNHQTPRPQMKTSAGPSNMTPAHTHERPNTEISPNQPIPHAHHNQYDALPGQAVNSFSLNDIEFANKKLYASNSNSSSTALDYGNWKVNQMRKPEMAPSDYSANSYTNNEEKLKGSDAPTPNALNYNKNVQHTQYNNYNSIPRSNTQSNQNPASSGLRIPNPRGLHTQTSTRSDAIFTMASIRQENVIKYLEQDPKTPKPESILPVIPLPYKTPYSTHSTLPMDTLRNLPNIPQMLERYTNNERYLSSFANCSPSLYHDKNFQMAQMFNKSTEAHHPASTSSSIYAQSSSSATSKDNIYKSSVSIANTQVDAKKNKRKRTSETKQSAGQSCHGYHTSTSNNDVLSSVKTSMMPASPFNFSSSSNMALGGMYADNGGFTIEDFRNSTNQLMAANYMAAAVAHQQRNNETTAEKIAKPAHQSSNHQSTSSFPFIGHSQVRAGYPFVGAEPSSPLYQQYLQRYQEELQRQTGAQIMGLYPSTYPTPLGVRQPYDSLNRPSWL